MISNIFQYIYDTKGKPIPLEYKLLNNTPLTEEDLTIRGSLYLSYSKITSLPNNLTVNGDLFLDFSDISFLPNNLIVNRNLFIGGTNISKLPDNLYVGGNIWCKFTPLTNNIKNDVSLLNKYSKQIKGRIFYGKYI